MGSDSGLILLAIALIAVAGLFAAMEAAVSRLSRSRVEDMARENRRGVENLRKILEDTPRYLNLALLLRTACEVTACAVVAVVCDRQRPGWLPVGRGTAVAGGGDGGGVHYVVVGVGRRAPSAGSTPDRSSR